MQASLDADGRLILPGARELIQTTPFARIGQAWREILDAYGMQGQAWLGRNDRYYLLTVLCNRLDMVHPWIYERCREIEAEPDGYLDLWAREHYKSSIITFGGSIQEILRDPEITICIFSHVGGISEDFVSQIKRELETNGALKRTYPEILWEYPEKNAPLWSVEGGIIVKRKGNPKEATVESSGLVDGTPIGKHYMLRIYDDVVTDKSVSTPEQVIKTTNSYSLSQSLGVIGGRQWTIGTRYSVGDTYQWVLDRKALKPRIYAATHNGLADGDPVFFTREEWAKRILSNTDSDIACQYLQNPIAGEHKMFDVKDLGVYELRPETLAVYILIDPARSKKKDSANTAMAVLGLDYASNKYLLDGFNHKMDLQERWARMLQLYVKWKQQVGIQAVYVGYEAFGAQADLDYFKEQQRLSKIHFDITELAWPRDGEGSKTDRVQRLTPDMKSHKILLPYPTDEKNLTASQRRMGNGYAYRIAKTIRRKDEGDQLYDLSEQFKMQVHFFPFGGKKDLIDAVSRIYDMAPRPPSVNEPRYAEPAFV